MTDKYESASVAAEFWCNKLKYPYGDDSLYSEDKKETIRILLNALDRKIPNDEQLEVFKMNLERNINYKLSVYGKCYLKRDYTLSSIIEGACIEAHIDKKLITGRIKMKVTRKKVIVKTFSEKNVIYPVENNKKLLKNKVK